MPRPQRAQQNRGSVKCAEQSQEGLDIVEPTFLYLNVQLYGNKIAALLDTGSSVNIMSNSLFQRLPDKCKSGLTPCVDKFLQLANGKSVDIVGTAKVQVQASCFHSKSIISVYVLNNTSHPFILGTDYLISEGLVLDFNKLTTYRNATRHSKVRIRDTITVPPNTEILTYGKVTKNNTVGSPGLCRVHNSLLNKGLLLSKAIVSVSCDNVVPVKLYNPGSEPVYVSRNSFIAHFEPLDCSYSVRSLDNENGSSDLKCNQVQAGDRDSDNITNVPSRSKFKSYFNLNENLSEPQQSELLSLLHDHHDIFVTDENPGLGLTNVIEHEIRLKPNAPSKHQQP